MLPYLNFICLNVATHATACNLIPMPLQTYFATAKFQIVLYGKSIKFKSYLTDRKYDMELV